MTDLLLPGLRTKGGSIAGRYRVERVLGTGHSGYVVLARHLILRQRVVLKILGRGTDLRPSLAAANLAGMHIARIIDTGFTEEGMPFIATEYVEGTTLAQVTANRPMVVTQAVHWVLQTCAGLAEAHAAGVVHGNLKPQNLMMSQDGVLKILDFGRLGRLEGGGVMASPAYLAPEQISDPEAITPETDIWSLGVILHRMISGSLPFASDSVVGMLVAVANDDPAPLADVSPKLADIVRACLSKDPKDRPRDVAALARALAPFAEPGAPALAASIGRMLGTSALVTADVGAGDPPAMTVHVGGPVDVDVTKPAGTLPMFRARPVTTAPSADEVVSVQAGSPLHSRLQAASASGGPPTASRRRKMFALLGGASVLAAVCLGLPDEAASRSSRAQLDPSPPPWTPEPSHLEVRALVPPTFLISESPESATESLESATETTLPLPDPTRSTLTRPAPKAVAREDDAVGFTHPSRLTARTLLPARVPRN